MPNYRRAHIPGGTFFFTVVTHRRRKLFHLEHNRSLLGHAIRQCQLQWSFEMNAIVLLPDHLHAIWTLPSARCEPFGPLERYQVTRSASGRTETNNCPLRGEANIVAGHKNPSPRPRFYLAAFVGVPFVFVATVALVARLVLDASHYDSFLGELWIVIGKFYLFVFLNILFSGILCFSTLIVLHFLPLHLFISEPSHPGFNSVLHTSFSRPDILSMIEEVQSRIEAGGSIESDELLEFYLWLLEDLAGHKKIPLQEIAKPRSPEDIYNELFLLASNP